MVFIRANVQTKVKQWLFITCKETKCDKGMQEIVTMKRNTCVTKEWKVNRMKVTKWATHYKQILTTRKGGKYSLVLRLCFLLHNNSVWVARKGDFRTWSHCKMYAGRWNHWWVGCWRTPIDSLVPRSPLVVMLRDVTLLARKSAYRLEHPYKKSSSYHTAWYGRIDINLRVLWRSTKHQSLSFTGFKNRQAASEV